MADVGPKLRARFRSQNLLLRPLGNTIYVMPPYCVTATDLDEVYAGIHDAVDALV
ncbi:adenosylmethionine-8-amino-7-oxononanoate aminotransferase [Bradyrhizobium niftali]